MTFDVVIIGSGFAGSILAWILSTLGWRVALIDAAQHPRFAIGESSTPIADRILRQLGRTYRLDQLETMSAWGSWQRHHGDLACGSKRGFSYYFHPSDQPFGESSLGEHSLLVAASPDAESADTHWYRSDVDAFFNRRAIESGATDFSNHRVVAVQVQAGQRIVQCVGARGSVSLRSRWVVDASGQAAVLARLHGSENQANQLRTRTHCLFGHYKNVQRWSEVAQSLKLDISRDPFDPDDAAQHHLCGDGWLWMLRFDNGITSVGFTTPTGNALRWPGNRSIKSMLASAHLVAPEGGPRVTQRLQRMFSPVIDSHQLMLPTAALTLDPLHSTGIAHALAGVQRVASILTEPNDQARADRIHQYGLSFDEESRFLDRLVSTAYKTMHDFDRFTVACMLYFAGAIQCEERYKSGEIPSHLWNADDRAFSRFVDSACNLLTQPEVDYWNEIRDGLRRWNHVGLMDRTTQNRYAYTATK